MTVKFQPKGKPFKITKLPKASGSRKVKVGKEAPKMKKVPIR